MSEAQLWGVAIVAFIGLIYLWRIVIKGVWFWFWRDEEKQRKPICFCSECAHHNSLAVCSNPKSINYTVKKRQDDWCEVGETAISITIGRKAVK